MSRDAPRVSVLLPVHDGGRWLESAIESLLAQTYPDFELLVLDDASSDATRAIAEAAAGRDPRVRVLTNETNLGLIASLNRLLREARAPLLARQDADDTSYPSRLEKQVAALDADARLGIVGTGFHAFATDGSSLGAIVNPVSDTAVRWKLLFNCPFNHSAVMFRAGLDVPGGLRYDTSAAHAEDYELWTRVLRVCRGANLPEPLVTLRFHEQSVSARHAAIQAETAARLSEAELARLAPDLALSGRRLELVRAAFHGSLRWDAPSWIDAYGLLFDVLDRFGAAEGIDRVEARSIGRQTLDGALARLPTLRVASLFGGGPVARLCRRVAGSRRHHLVRRTMRRLFPMAARHALRGLRPGGGRAP